MKVEFQQKSRFTSPWTVKQRLKMLIWEYTWLLLCSWTPKPFNKWRLFWLKSFGCLIQGRPFVHQRARIQIPWNLKIHDKACLGDRANVYSLGEIEIFEKATIAQEVYLCSGTHAFDKKSMNLITKKITIHEEAFVGARAFIMPGISIGRHALVGANSVVTKNVNEYEIVAGNPAKFLKTRIIN